MTDWREIVEQHGPLVWRTVRRLVPNEADAADCFQGTFVSALEFLRTSEVHNWTGLLKRLATARAIECFRRQRREASRLTNLPEHGTVDPSAVLPLKAAQANELAERLRAALFALDEQSANVFCLACLEGFSYHEIAHELRLSVSHVGVLLSRARATLRTRLASFAPGAVTKATEKESES